jgi:translation initiation factor 4G
MHFTDMTVNSSFNSCRSVATLPPLDAIGIEPLDHSSLHLMCGGSGCHRTSSAALPPQRQASIGLGFSPGTMGKGVSNSFNPMGNFGTGAASKLSSEDRFAARSRAASVSGAAGMPFARPMPMTRTASTGPMAQRDRVRSKRGERRDPNKFINTGQNQASTTLQNQQMDFESVAPLQATANRFQVQADGDSPEMVECKVKGLLNKLTMEKIDSISDQIISWANKSENEKDGRTLIQVIKLVFEKATDANGEL